MTCKFILDQFLPFFHRKQKRLGSYNTVVIYTCIAYFDMKNDVTNFPFLLGFFKRKLNA